MYQYWFIFIIKSIFFLTEGKAFREFNVKNISFGFQRDVEIIYINTTWSCATINQLEASGCVALRQSGPHKTPMTSVSISKFDIGFTRDEEKRKLTGHQRYLHIIR